MPESKNLMNTKLNYIFDHQDYNFSTNFQIFEQLGTKHSDRYQYVIPEYNFNRSQNLKNVPGAISFSSSGSNNLKDIII